MALPLQRLERPDHVVRGDGAAVMEARLAPEGEGHPRTVRWCLDRLGDQAVLREGLVAGLDGERLEELADPRRGEALEHERVERVEGADGGQPCLTALGRARVRVAEVGEARAVLQVAVHRQPVSDGDGGALALSAAVRMRGEDEQQHPQDGRHHAHIAKHSRRGTSLTTTGRAPDILTEVRRTGLAGGRGRCAGHPLLANDGRKEPLASGAVGLVPDYESLQIADDPVEGREGFLIQRLLLYPPRQGRSSSWLATVCSLVDTRT